MSTTVSKPELPPTRHAASGLLVYLLLGIAFGILLIKSEVVSWFRIQEMFRFQGFHMFGIFATAMPTAIVGVQLIKRRRWRTLRGELITIPPKHFGTGVRYIAGGVMFGFGWALVGACPGPLFALLGSGIFTIAVVLFFALVGTWCYGLVRPYLPH